jgi:YHS domain-containing protein
MRKATYPRNGTTRQLIAGAAFAAALAAWSGPALADGVVNTGYFGGVAINGYDPVAYFTENRAMKGSEKYTYDWLGTPWHFANDDHRELFRSDPVKYAPQYGGYCAGEVAGSGSTTVNIDPVSFKIIEGKLYLTYDKVHTDGFGTDAAEIKKADANWPALEGKLQQ